MTPSTEELEESRSHFGKKKRERIFELQKKDTLSFALMVTGSARKPRIEGAAAAAAGFVQALLPC
jgi:hypothetical protein